MSDPVELTVQLLRDTLRIGDLGLEFAVTLADGFAENIKADLSEEKFWELKARLSQVVLDWQAEKEHGPQQEPTPPPPPAEEIKGSVVIVDDPPVRFGLVEELRDLLPPGNDPLGALWESIRRTLPEDMRDDPKVARRIGFLCGLGIEKAAWRILSRFFRG
jgi:hypothetical protein